jgi:RHS repeat-associated protein
VTYGSTDADDFSYSPNTGALNSYVFHAGSQNATGDLTWNTNGSLKQLQITDQMNATNTQTCTYLHDDLGRIGLPPGSAGKSVDCGTTHWQQNFSFDPFSNITKTVPTGGTGVIFTPTYSSGTNRYTSLPGFTPTYDANGDLTADGTHSFAWDVEGHAVTIDTVTLTYDALGRMVEQARSGTFTQIVYGPTGKFALMNGQTLMKGFAPLPGGGSAVYTPGVSPAYYRHSDWLGSSRLATTPSRGVYYDAAYGPFGESYAATGTTDVSFTGQNQDTVSDLNDFMFREYNPAHGRWMSPDPAGSAAVDPARPQTWNRYAYVANNPLVYIDPDGTTIDDGFTASQGGGYGFANGIPFVPGTTINVTDSGMGVQTVSSNSYEGSYLYASWTGSSGGTGTSDGAAGTGSPNNGKQPQQPQQPQQPKKPCYSGNSLRDKEVRFFSLLRLRQTWDEWALGGGSKLVWFGAAKAGAKAAGGQESLGVTALGTGGTALGLAGTAAMVEATKADASCQTGGFSDLLLAPLEPSVH